MKKKRPVTERNAMKVTRIKAISRRESYNVDEIDDGHTGYAVYVKDLHSGLKPGFAIALDDQRQARRALRFLLKSMGVSRKIQGTFRQSERRGDNGR